MAVRVGCCGFPVARRRYFETFSAVEIQQTFYQPPRAATAESWRAEAPAGFEFTLKAWQLITHEARSPTYRRLREPLSPAEARSCGAFRKSEIVERAWERTRAVARALGARLVLFQAPPSLTPTHEHIRNIRRFFRDIERDGLTCAWEPRGQWRDDVVSGLCRELDLVHAVDPFQRHPVTTGPCYFRLHGRTGPRYRYTPEDMQRLAELCRCYGRGYCLFNNVAMWDDARAFLAHLRARPRAATGYGRQASAPPRPRRGRP